VFSADDLVDVLPDLARVRPVFHSEADFQHALAWQVQLTNPQLRVRLETRPEPGVHLDLLVCDPSDGFRLAVELKYLTDHWEGEVDGESFNLKQHGASDLGGYDSIKDVCRLERFVASRYADAGALIILSNDPIYWTVPTHGRITSGDAFRLHEGVVLSGQRAWGPNTGAGTMAGGRTLPIELAGTYPLHWEDYSRVAGKRGLFRRLALLVAAAQ
jgi:hypothetical protein